MQLPHISNFTDFSIWRRSGCAHTLRRRPEALTDADLVILPGGKNTLSDLARLRSGMADAVLPNTSAGRAGDEICGGYQMLGDTIVDEGWSRGWVRSRAQGCLIRSLALLG